MNRNAALVLLVAGGAGSESLMLYVGRHNRSALLLFLFTIWVLSPFAALLWLNVVANARAIRNGVMLTITLASLAIYGEVALRPPKAKAAPAFVMVPLLSWVIIAIIAAMAKRASGKALRRG